MRVGVRVVGLLPVVGSVMSVFLIIKGAENSPGNLAKKQILMQ